MAQELKPVKIGALPQAETIADDDLFVLEHEGNAYKLTGKEFIEYVAAIAISHRYVFNVDDTGNLTVSYSD